MWQRSVRCAAQRYGDEVDQRQVGTPYIGESALRVAAKHRRDLEVDQLGSGEVLAAQAAAVSPSAPSSANATTRTLASTTSTVFAHRRHR